MAKQKRTLPSAGSKPVECGQQPVKVNRNLHAPAKSLCTCGHSGDGTNSMHGGYIGHGPCRYAGCDCQKFSWAKFL